MGWIGCVHYEKPRRDFVARTFALIAPVYPVLHRVSCSYKKIINAPKHYATHQNMSLGPNGVDWVCSLRKISTLLRGTSLCINCTSSHCFESSFMQFWNDPKCTQTPCNAPKHEFRSNGVDWVRSLQKIPTWLRGTNFCINVLTLFCNEFHTVMKRSQMHPNTMQRTKIWVYGPMGRIGCFRCKKSLCDFMARILH